MIMKLQYIASIHTDTPSNRCVTGVTQRVTRLTGRIKKCVRFNTLRTLLDVLKSCGNAVRRALHVDTSQASRGAGHSDRRKTDGI